jgi:TPR repeat protein
LVELLERACEGGVRRACVALGERLAVARGANRQSARAAAILTKACTAEPPAGCATLGRLLLDGISVTPDRALARHYLRRGCALEGDTASCRELDRLPSVRFFNAEDVPQQAR